MVCRKQRDSDGPLPPAAQRHAIFVNKLCPVKAIRIKLGKGDYLEFFCNIR